MSPRRSSSWSQREIRSVSNSSRSAGVSGSSRYNLPVTRFPIRKHDLPVPGVDASRRPGRARPRVHGTDQSIENEAASRAAPPASRNLANDQRFPETFVRCETWTIPSRCSSAVRLFLVEARSGQGVIFMRIPLRSPRLFSWPPSQNVPRLLKASLNVSKAEAAALAVPPGLAVCYGPQKRLYAHPRQASGPTTMGHPRELLLPFPRAGVGILTECRASTRAHLYSQVRHVVVDLEEPSNPGATIGWPASGAIQQPAYQLRRIHLPRTRANRGQEGQGEGPEPRGIPALYTVPLAHALFR